LGLGAPRRMHLLLLRSLLLPQLRVAAAFGFARAFG
jgi:hypothetical protein